MIRQRPGKCFRLLKMLEDIRTKFSTPLAIGIVALVFATVLKTEWRNGVRSYFIPPYRKVIAIAPAMFDGTNILQVLKVRNDTGLYLELYDSQQILSRVKLPHRQDGYFTFGGAVTNLAIDDIDGDKMPEVLAPTYDDELSPHLNAFKYNPTLKNLEPVVIK